MSTTGYGLEEQINDLNAELRDTRATLRQSLQHRDTLRAELAEARAQIAAKDAALKHLATVTLENLAGLRALIEVKDVALTRIVNECSAFPIKDGLAFRVESIALNGLAAPAREPEQKPMYSLDEEED